ncbi:hypothetical protein GPECTOR_47g344 [Gonium pectorale]|uniref:Uncharacterized protein n=1 Tax=Gonium pectorale TaxID=33097 RepID=A0A150G886_GONPE|nr:hypothetical protein GPECTOR_47g344 [Gonium pectorale]|eukprot:KXZ46069.1 hypothetical protein GPECTOR_47g344 [Gonium pectorale]
MAYAGDLWANLNGPIDPPAAWSEVLWPPSALLFAAMGLVLGLAACAGLVAASRYSWLLLNLHMGLLALTLVGAAAAAGGPRGQVCLAAAVATVSDGGGGPVPGRTAASLSSSSSSSSASSSSGLLSSLRAGGAAGGTGSGASVHSAAAAAARFAAAGADGGVRRELRDALMAYPAADAVAVTVEVVALLFGCLLHSAFTRADARAEDVEEGLADPTAPLLVSRRRNEAREAASGRGRGGRGGGSGTGLPPRVQRNDSWSRRMREQYGIDTSILSYNPEATAAAAARLQQAPGAAAAAPAAAPPAAAAPGGSGRCVIS